MEEWLEMMDHVDLAHPSQDAVAAVVSSLYRIVTKNQIPDLPDPWPYDPDWFNRTQQQRIDYYRQTIAHQIGSKLLNTSGILLKERAKYLSLRFVSLTLFSQGNN